MKNPNVYAPKAGQSVSIIGSDYMGDWNMNGYRKDYKQKPNVGAYNDKGIYWRFVDSDGERITDVDGWEDV